MNYFSGGFRRQWGLKLVRVGDGNYLAREELAAWAMVLSELEISNVFCFLIIKFKSR